MREVNQGYIMNTYQTKNVPIITLDEYCKKNNFYLNDDTQGYEVNTN